MDNAFEDIDEVMEDDIFEDAAMLDGAIEVTTDVTELEDFTRLDKEDIAALEFVDDGVSLDEPPPPQATNALEHIVKNIARIIIFTSTQIQ